MRNGGSTNVPPQKADLGAVGYAIQIVEQDEIGRDGAEHIVWFGGSLYESRQVMGGLRCRGSPGVPRATRAEGRRLAAPSLAHGRPMQATNRHHTCPPRPAASTLYLVRSVYLSACPAAFFSPTTTTRPRPPTTSRTQT